MAAYLDMQTFRPSVGVILKKSAPDKLLILLKIVAKEGIEGRL
jgi:hypothetical protein